MTWIVLKDDKGKTLLVSDRKTDGLIPKGSFLTVEQEDEKFILRVDESYQLSLYDPDPLVVDMDLSSLEEDRKTKNILYAYRIYDFTDRDDDLISTIKPQSKARRSNQEEINVALGSYEKGSKVFVATVQYSKNQLLRDQNGRLITASLPNDMFFHQVLICGKTGSGKTVAAKYLMQYFAEELGGSVLAINVKDVDLLRMDQPSLTANKKIKEEWRELGKKAKGISNYVVYYPANSKMNSSSGVNLERCYKVTLDVKEINPESLNGLLLHITDMAAMSLPNIFRKWQEDIKKSKDEGVYRFSNFVKYFNEIKENGCEFPTLNATGQESFIRLHRGTAENISRNLDVANEFFDNEFADTLNEDDILVEGKVSVIDVASENGIQFGSILLRNLLHKIVASKRNNEHKEPILIVIDEVHMFYNVDASREALGDLDTICRTGRSQEIGVIFSSQNPRDIPKGLTSVINTKIFFRSDVEGMKMTGGALSLQEMESLGKGFAVAYIHDLPQLRVIKFPLAYSGVFEEK